MLVSVCVATVRGDTLPMTVRAIQAQTWPDWELVLVPQGSDSALQAACAQAAVDPRVSVVHLNSKGLSAARNAGAMAASGAIIAFTDDDCEPAPDWLSTLACAFQAGGHVGLVGGAVVPPATARPLISTCPALHPSEAIYEPATGMSPPPGWDWIGANFAIRREIFQQIGQFDLHLGAGARFPAGDDTDYKLRLEAAGIAMRSTPAAVVHHTYGVRTGLKARKAFSRNYATGNGALAGKLTLMGDPRGEEWLRLTHDYCFRQLKSGRLDRFPRAFNRYRTYAEAYRKCTTEFHIDPATRNLAPNLL